MSIRWPPPANSLPSTCTLLVLASHSAGTEFSAVQTQVGSAGVRLHGAQCRLFMPSSEGRYRLGHTPDIRGQSGHRASTALVLTEVTRKCFPRRWKRALGLITRAHLRAHTHACAHTHPRLQLDPLQILVRPYHCFPQSAIQQNVY